MTTFGSVCSGIEAASVAWHPLGNSMAVPVMRWIGEQIIEKLKRTTRKD